MVTPLNFVTGKEAGLSGDDQIRFALQEIIRRGGMAETRDLYDAIESVLAPRGMRLSDQGKASFRNFVNTVAVQAGFVNPHDPDAPGWRITAEGRAFAQEKPDSELAINVDSGSEQSVPSNSARGDAFERYTLTLLRRIYPQYAWYHQGAIRAGSAA